MYKKIIILILLLCMFGVTASYAADIQHPTASMEGTPKIPGVLIPTIPDIPRAEIPAPPSISGGIPHQTSSIVTRPGIEVQKTTATVTEAPVNVSRAPSNVNFAPDRVIVRYKTDKISATGASSPIREKMNAGIGAKVLADERQMGISGMEVVQLQSGTSVQQAVDFYTKNSDVAYAEPDYIVQALPTGDLKVPIPINARAVNYREQVGQTHRTSSSSPDNGGEAISRVPPTQVPTPSTQEGNEAYGYMHISPEQRIKMIVASRKTPDLPNTQGIIPQADMDLLQYVPYTGTSRDQGNCGNCWVWASTGAIEVAHAVQSGVKDRLSIQYFNSNYNGGTGYSWACMGGWAEGFASFHSTTGFKQVIPWTNTNASYADGTACSGGSCSGTKMPASRISTTPNYPLTSISVSDIRTYEENQEQAIANIKYQLNTNKAVWWAFWLPDSSSWSTFCNYWAYQADTALWNPDPYNGLPYTATGGGHAVLIVGYDDTSSDPNQRYWKVLNSWGTTSQRTTGMFRLKMNMNYAGVDSNGYLNHEFKVFNTAFGGATQTGSISVTSTPTNARIWLDGTDSGKNAPDSLSSVSAGTHTVSLKLSGYNDYLTSVTVTGGQTSTVTGTLAAIQTGNIFIQSNPTEATVFLNNQGQGGSVTPATLASIPAGSHSMRLTKSGYQDWMQTVTVATGQTSQISASMIATNPKFLVIPNDPFFSYLYGLHNTGQTEGTEDADIDAPEAWVTTTGSSSVVVAVIDTGVDYSHPDLAANIWTDPVTGYHGYDYANNDNDPMDDHGHGTHCAGTIGAVGNNGVGVAGVNWNVKIMALKFLDSSGSGYISNAISAIQYANSHGAQVISDSWGGAGNSQALKDAIDASSAVVVCAAGNNGVNTDTSPQYPSAYPSNNIIAVAATDDNDNLASFSNYGATSVDVAAPGVSIYSTYPGNLYTTMSGTSMATPHVAGVAALVKAAAPSYTAAQIKTTIMNGVDMKPGLSGRCVTGGRLNAKNSIGNIGGINTNIIAAFSNGYWYIDSDNSHTFNTLDQIWGQFGAGSTPLVIDNHIAAFNNGYWFIDIDDSKTWNTGDQIWGQFGAGSTPLVIDNHIAAFNNGYWFIDINDNHAWDSGDTIWGQFGTGLTPLMINKHIAAFSNGYWYIDTNDNHLWDSGDTTWGQFGAGSIPLMINNHIAAFSNGYWFIDTNDNHSWDSGDTIWGQFGAGSTPLVF